MKIHKIHILIILLSLPLTGLARTGTYQTYARVLDVQPIVETSSRTVIKRTCNKADGYAHLSKPLASSIGKDIRKQNLAWQKQTACNKQKEKHPRKKVTAYRVTYRYGGYTKTTRLSYHPGKRIPVNIGVSALP